MRFSTCTSFSREHEAASSQDSKIRSELKQDADSGYELQFYTEKTVLSSADRPAFVVAFQPDGKRKNVGAKSESQLLSVYPPASPLTPSAL